LSRQALGDLRRKTVLVVGAGEAGQRAAAALVQNGAGRLLVTTRRSGRAEEIAAELNGAAFAFDELPKVLHEADVMITCTAATEAVVSAADIAAAMASRPERPLVIVDIAVPRDVEPAARELAGVRLFDIDDLQAMAEKNRQARESEVAGVEAIVADEARRFEVWLQSRGVTPTIAALRRQAEAARRAEVERTLARLGSVSDADRERIEAMTKAIVKRLLHEPVTRLRSDATERDLDAVRHLFGLEDD
jgi:glutamyl-tRNA reductase